ncbi:hypothetical protein [Sinomonas sp. R1AF57]|uniref:hypothetical protein n=1 Tax=Sinomonas sp. R1AF57 TaxID=2020377 RepID=UPI000B5DC6D8|nr:hypothetical protein [Sinomonas sp. R1AF57]ASN53041.1 hypothetical protein CGQ25_13830 [Sinomonas sp. R1AF57]
MTNAPDYRAALSRLCPLSDPETGTLVGFDGRFWPVEVPVALTALSLLPPRALGSITADFPRASRPARHHIADAAEILADTAGEWLERRCTEPDAEDANLRSVCQPLAAEVSNAVAYREILDAVCGEGDDDEGLREAVLPAALTAFETGKRPRLDEVGDDAAASSPAALPRTDYFSVDSALRERAGAYLMAFALAPECDDPATPLAARTTEPDQFTAFALAHLHQPQRYADAVREHRTLDPKVLGPAIAARTPAPEPLPWGA